MRMSKTDISELAKWDGYKELKERGYSDESIELVRQGLEELAEGKTKSLGSFAKYVEEDNNDE